jgi:hypothetical protein
MFATAGTSRRKRDNTIYENHSTTAAASVKGKLCQRLHHASVWCFGCCYIALIANNVDAVMLCLQEQLRELAKTVCDQKALEAQENGEKLAESKEQGKI